MNLKEVDSTTRCKAKIFPELNITKALEQHAMKALWRRGRRATLAGGRRTTLARTWRTRQGVGARLWRGLGGRLWRGRPRLTGARIWATLAVIAQLWPLSTGTWRASGGDRGRHGGTANDCGLMRTGHPRKSLAGTLVGMVDNSGKELGGRVWRQRWTTAGRKDLGGRLDDRHSWPDSGTDSGRLWHGRRMTARGRATLESLSGDSDGDRTSLAGLVGRL